MNINFTTYNTIIIKDSDGKIVDKFKVQSVETSRHPITGKNVIITKAD